MLSLKRFVMFVVVISVAVLSPPSSGSAFGQTSEPEATPAAPTEEKKVDPFVVPEGGPAELIEYLASVRKQQPNPREDRRAFIEFMVKSSKPVWEAADKILADPTATKEQKVIAAKAKFGALNILIQLRNPQAVNALEQLPQELTDLGLTDLANAAQSQSLSIGLSKSLARAPGAAPVEEVLGKIQTLVAGNPSSKSFQLAYGAVSALQHADKLELAAELCDKFEKVFTEGGDEKATELAERFAAMARRLRLLGNPMKVEGTLLDGTPLDWDAYRGKVVLVQFWATWCGYCVKEIPHIEEQFNEYRDRGFDVIAISLDRGLEPLEKFLEKKPLPWAVVYKEGERNPTADYYGVTGLPTLILVDKEGKVVSLNARGPKLDEALEKLLGPPKEKKDEKKEEPETKTEL
ncbi:MAG: TlpA family protein disulfide reductase [Pirellulaceae bacterium]|nr:TlpA family protein disulfide reductase [Pirellulaceae bacterium]